MKKNKSLSVLQVIPSLHMGGVERAVCETSYALVDAGIKAYVTSSGGRLVEALEKKGVHHITLDVGSKNPLTMARVFFDLVRLIKEHSIDVVHVRSRAPAWPVYFACKKTGVKMVSTLHGVYEADNIFSRFYARAMMKADAVIAVSHFVKDYSVKAFGWDASKIEVIQNGIDPDYFFLGNVNLSEVLMLKSLHGIDDDAFVLLLPGRAVKRKGHDWFLEALAHIHKPVHALFLGVDIQDASPYTKDIIQKAKALEGRHFIHFIAPQQNVLPYYAVASCVVLPSVKILESFGRGAVEAASFERLTIATAEGGYLETIVDGKTGFFVEPYDALDLSAKMRHVMELSRAKRQKMGEDARAHVMKHFLLKNTLKKTIALYKSLVLR